VNSNLRTSPQQALLVLLLLACSFGCAPAPEEPSYRAATVTRRDIVLGAEAAGIIEPQLTVEVKSKASGEILEIPVETGTRVERGALLVRIDPRQPKNAVSLARADLEAARARLTLSREQATRAELLFARQSIPKTQLEQARLDAADAKAAVIRAQVALENAEIQLEDTQVDAPITGTVIQKNVEAGQVISSPTQDVSGGTVLLQMADLAVVSVRTLVDETDIGRIEPGVAARVSVAAYPDRSFDGQVQKIEPQAVTEQNVTMFPVRVRLDNPDGLLRPGMNCSVEIRVSERLDVVAVPNAALVPPKDAGQLASLLGAEVQGGPDVAARSQFVVFRQTPSGPVATPIQTGITNLDHTEVLSGLSEGDRVLLLPSAGLVRSQEQFMQRIRRFTGGGVLGRRQ